MFTHELMERLGAEACAIQRRNEAGRLTSFAKGALGQDVVSQTDLDNERMLRALFRRELPSLGYIYGEENGLELTGGGSGGALIDPIDGTRPYTAGIFRSGVSVTFTDAAGAPAAGFIVSLNNQTPGDVTLWTWDGASVRCGGAPFTPAPQPATLKQVCVSVTSVPDFPDEQRALAALLFKLTADRSRGPLSFCSGASEVLAVLEGRLGAFLNVGTKDLVSHAAAVGMARTLGLHVRHIFTPGDDFSVRFDRERRTLSPAGELSLALCPQSLSGELDALIDDALRLLPRFMESFKEGTV